MNQPLWQPSPERVARANVTAFTRAAEARWGVRIPDYASLDRWSVQHSERFWSSVWEFSGIVGELGSDRVLLDGDRMPGAKWFPDARLNFAENLLKRRDDETAIVFRGEDKARRALTYRQLYDQVSRTAQALQAAGIKPGDRVAAYVPNLPETLIAMLAATSLGAIWSSCSPDFGMQGVLDRFGQIEPKVLFSADGYYYNGKPLDSLERAAGIVKQLPSVEKTVILPYLQEQADVGAIRGGIGFGDFIAPFKPGDIRFERLPFDHPLYILYSSGTTGAPKCIVHGAGGTLIQHLKEHLLHVDEKPGDRLFYFTTCGWMMWNWLVSGLAAGSSSCSRRFPFHPDAKVLFDYIDEAKSPSSEPPPSTSTR